MTVVPFTPRPKPRRQTAADVAARAAALAHYFGLSRAPVDVLIWLLLKSGEPLSAIQLAVLCSTTTRAVRTSVFVLRQALEAEAIDTDVEGYRLTPAGVAECQTAFSEMAQSLRDMGEGPACA